jgi:hypothetical protein
MHAWQFRSSEASGQELTRLALRRVVSAYAPTLAIERIEETTWADFVLHASGRRIGVDVMPMQWKVAKTIPTADRQLHLRREVVSAALREFQAARGPAEEVLVRFDEARPLNRASHR